MAFSFHILEVFSIVFPFWPLVGFTTSHDQQQWDVSIFFTAHKVELVYILWRDSTGINVFFLHCLYFSQTSKLSGTETEFKMGGRPRLVKYCSWPEFWRSISRRGFLGNIVHSPNSDDASPVGASGKSDQLDCVVFISKTCRPSVTNKHFVIVYED